MLIGDDNQALKQYLASQPDFAIVGSVSNARTVLEQIETLNP